MADYFIQVKVIRLSPATGDCSIIGLATDPDFSPTAVFDLRTRTTERRITRAIKNRGYKLQLPILPCDPLRSLAPIRFPSLRFPPRRRACQTKFSLASISVHLSQPDYHRERERESQRVSIEYSKFIDRVGGKLNGRSVSRRDGRLTRVRTRAARNSRPARVTSENDTSGESISFSVIFSASRYTYIYVYIHI